MNGRDHLEGLGINIRKMLKWTQKGRSLYILGSVYGSVASYHEYGNKLPGPLNGRNLLSSRDVIPAQDILCSMVRISPQM
jgi:hypothetical protein